MSDSQAFRWERVSDQTRFQRDPALAVPPEVEKLLTQGAEPPFRILQTAGVYFYFGRLPQDAKAKKPLPNTKLKLWTQADGLIVIEDGWAIGAEATFDLGRRRGVAASASDEERKESALFEVDFDTRRKTHLIVDKREEAWGFDSAFHMADGNVAARSRNRIYTMTRDGDRLTPGSVELDTGDVVYIALGGRYVVTAATIWEISMTATRVVAEFPGLTGLPVRAFDGRVLRYTREGCFQLFGPF